jgi:hypothetical protein
VGLEERDERFREAEVRGPEGSDGRELPQDGRRLGDLFFRLLAQQLRERTMIPPVAPELVAGLHELLHDSGEDLGRP